MSKHKSFLNKKFSRLTVLEYLGTSLYKCLCSCGETKKIRRYDLVSNRTRSCGCLRKESNTKRFTLNIKGKKFGFLTAIKQIDVFHGPKSKIWVCKCTCGKYKNVPISYLKNGGVKSCGCKTNELKRFSKLDERNPNWSDNKYGYAAVHDWVRRRKDKPTICAFCSKKTKYLDLANISQKYLRNINDFEWLCRSCHMKKDGRLKNLKNQ